MNIEQEIQQFDLARQNSLKMFERSLAGIQKN